VLVIEDFDVVSVPLTVDIELDLFKLFENIAARVQFFIHSVCTAKQTLLVSLTKSCVLSSRVTVSERELDELI